MRSKRVHDRQPLNPLDLALRCVDRTIRGMGYPGFETQMLVWLAGRVDVDRLRSALLRLSRRRPVVTARLVDETSTGGRPFWQYRSAGTKLDVIDLPLADSSAVFAHAEQLISTSHDPATCDPVRFHLLRRAGAGDVLLVQYNHVLMDNTATVPLAREIDQLADPAGPLDDAPRHEPQNVHNHWLRRIAHADRRAASEAAVTLFGRTLRGRAALLSTGEEDKPRQLSLRVLTRTLEPEQVRAIHAHSARLCGLPSLSMAILASTFRAIQKLGPAERNASRNYIAGIGLDMNLRRKDQALLQNLLSVVPIFARPGELADRDSLIRLLSGQIRERLASKIDWGALRLASGFQRKPRHIRWVAEHLLRWTYSLWYAYFGSLDGVGRTFCGEEVENVQYIGPTWSPLGISLLANQFRGRLHFQATYDPDLVAEGLAEDFLDAIVQDL